MFVAPVSIKLSIWEIRAMDAILTQCLNAWLNQPDQIRLEAILLAEYAPVWFRQCQGYKLDECKWWKDKKCKLPLSIAKVVWYRLQFIPSNGERQSILAKLDLVLTQQKVKPKFSNSLFDKSL